MPRSSPFLFLGYCWQGRGTLHFLILLVTVLVVLVAPATEALGAVAALVPFFTWTVLCWLETRGQGFLVVEVACGKEVGLGGVSFPCLGLTEGLLSLATGPPGRRGRSVRVGFVSILRRCSVRAACCLRSLCLPISCSSSWRKPGRDQDGRWSPRLGRKALGRRSLADPLSRLTHCHPWWGGAGAGAGVGRTRHLHARLIPGPSGTVLL